MQEKICLEKRIMYVVYLNNKDKTVILGEIVYIHGFSLFIPDSDSNLKINHDSTEFRTVLNTNY